MLDTWQAHTGASGVHPNQKALGRCSGGQVGHHEVEQGLSGLCHPYMILHDRVTHTLDWLPPDVQDGALWLRSTVTLEGNSKLAKIF